MSGAPARPAPAAAPGRPRVVLVEDDPDIAEAITYQLERTGFTVRTARTGEEGLEVARRGAELILLDLNLPAMDGLEACRLLRRQPSTLRVPIIIVSARAEEIDRVLGLEMGADDYVVKPFSMKELAARCRATLRRAEAAEEAPAGYHDANFAVDFEAFRVRFQGEEIRLTAKEFALFRALLERPGRVLTRDGLLDRIWGDAGEVDARSVDAHVRRLRVKLGPARAHVETIVGIGYRFVAEPGGRAQGTPPA